MPNQVWGHDFRHFTRAGRVAIVVLDLVSRYWIPMLVSVEESSERVKAIYTLVLEDQGLLAEAERRMIAPNSDEELPILLAVSDIHTACAGAWPSPLLSDRSRAI